MNKSNTSIAIVLFLLFAMTISLVAIPDAVAQEPLRVKTFPFVGAVPNPVGVGQEALLAVGITMPLSSTGMGWEGLSVTVTRPDGTTETIRDLRTDSTGMTGTVYVPTMTGNYTLQSHFPEQETTSAKVAGDIFKGYLPVGAVMLAGSSLLYTLEVQEEPVIYHPGHPLPTEYWTRPIDAQLWEWASIAGNWLDTPSNYYTPFNEGPETAHILWTKPIAMGGLVGGAFDGGDVENIHGFECGDAYEGKFSQRFILGGRLYYQKHAATQVYKEMACVDLHTGEELWSRVLLDNRTVSFVQLMYWDTFNYHGTYPYLWVVVGSTYHAFDAFTGDWVYAMTNVPSGTRVFGPKGEILIYTVNLANGWMTMWNSTNIPALYGAQVHPSDPGYMWMHFTWGSWRPYGRTVNATGPFAVTPDTPLGLAGYQWNKTIPTGIPGNVERVWAGDRIIGAHATRAGITNWALSLKPGEEGRLLFNQTWNAPALWQEGQISPWGQMGGWTAWSQEEYVATLWLQETRENYAFCLETGNLLWGPTEPQYYMDAMGYKVMGRAIAYGKFYSVSLAGIMYCYDVRTGDLLWTYEVADPYSEILWANNWWSNILFITDGKIYIGHQEHSPIDPKPRGAPFVCLDAETGEEIFRVDGLFRQTHWGGRAIIGDSVMVTMDTYDQRIYGVGKGPSAMTATIQNDVTTHGNKVLVTGTVTDVSPGTRDAALQMRFPNGVPAVADESMSEWMLYVYKQFARPADVMGVEIVVSVLDPNNNCYEVGRTTADDDGFFSVEFEPEVPGKYTVIATFEGSKAYYGSHAKTAVTVQEAPAPVADPAPPPESIADIYFLPAVIGIIIAIAIVGVVLVLMLRKR